MYDIIFTLYILYNFSIQMNGSFNQLNIEFLNFPKSGMVDEWERQLDDR